MQLTKRESEVVAKVLCGQKRASIAADLGIAVRTVDVYLLRVRRKLGVSSMVEIAVFFTREPLTVHSRE